MQSSCLTLFAVCIAALAVAQPPDVRARTAFVPAKAADGQKAAGAQDAAGKAAEGKQRRAATRAAGGRAQTKKQADAEDILALAKTAVQSPDGARTQDDSYQSQDSASQAAAEQSESTPGQVDPYRAGRVFQQIAKPAADPRDRAKVFVRSAAAAGIAGDAAQALDQQMLKAIQEASGSAKAAGDPAAAGTGRAKTRAAKQQVDGGMQAAVQKAAAANQGPAPDFAAQLLNQQLADAMDSTAKAVAENNVVQPKPKPNAKEEEGVVSAFNVLQATTSNPNVGPTTTTSATGTATTQQTTTSAQSTTATSTSAPTSPTATTFSPTRTASSTSTTSSTTSSSSSSSLTVPRRHLASDAVSVFALTTFCIPISLMTLAMAL